LYVHHNRSRSDLPLTGVCRIHFDKENDAVIWITWFEEQEKSTTNKILGALFYKILIG
jgi:hypothetical protein